jgi:hypothetical protein
MAVLCLLLGWGFAVLRVSVMIGTPSLACVITAKLRSDLAADYRLVYRDAKNDGLEVYQRQANGSAGAPGL